jgi:hypothetical protein
MTYKVVSDQRKFVKGEHALPQEKQRTGMIILTNNVVLESSSYARTLETRKISLDSVPEVQLNSATWIF